MKMDSLLSAIIENIVLFLILFGIFMALRYIVKFAVGKISSMSYFKTSRFFNPTEYFPEEEVHSIRQILYLAMILILTMNIIYILLSWRDDSVNLLAADIIISVYISLEVDGSSLKNRIILLLVVPFASLSYLLYPSDIVFAMDIFHAVGCLYFIKVYYTKFLKYTSDNRLGITIMLLFLIVFVSFFITLIVEDVSPLDSIVMVSNAFTSNGYSVLGKSGLGKLNSLLLVWSGFILSGVGTATLTVSMVMREVNRKFDHLEDLAKKNKKG